jgi:hypothetical protein
MLAKTLVMSVAAAIFGPIIGIGVFLITNTDYFGHSTRSFAASGAETGPPMDSRQTNVVRMFAPSGQWLDPVSISGQKPKAETAVASSSSTELDPWRTVVSCQDGQPLNEDSRCSSPEIVSTRLAGKRSVRELIPGGIASKVEIREGAPSSPELGRMSVGGP